MRGSREESYSRWVESSKKEEESLLIFGGSEEHFRYGFFAHFLFILPHYHWSLSSHPATWVSVVYFVAHWAVLNLNLLSCLLCFGSFLVSWISLINSCHIDLFLSSIFLLIMLLLPVSSTYSGSFDQFMKQDLVQWLVCSSCAILLSLFFVFLFLYSWRPEGQNFKSIGYGEIARGNWFRPVMSMWWHLIQWKQHPTRNRVPCSARLATHCWIPNSLHFLPVFMAFWWPRWVLFEIVVHRHIICPLYWTAIGLI